MQNIFVICSILFLPLVFSKNRNYIAIAIPMTIVAPLLIMLIGKSEPVYICKVIVLSLLIIYRFFNLPMLFIKKDNNEEKTLKLKKHSFVILTILTGIFTMKETFSASNDAVGGVIMVIAALIMTPYLFLEVLVGPLFVIE